MRERNRKEISLHIKRIAVNGINGQLGNEVKETPQKLKRKLEKGNKREDEQVKEKEKRSRKKEIEHQKQRKKEETFERKEKKSGKKVRERKRKERSLQMKRMKVIGIKFIHLWVARCELPRAPKKNEFLETSKIFLRRKNSIIRSEVTFGVQGRFVLFC